MPFSPTPADTSTPGWAPATFLDIIDVKMMRTLAAATPDKTAIDPTAPGAARHAIGLIAREVVDELDRSGRPGQVFTELATLYCRGTIITIQRQRAAVIAEAFGADVGMLIRYLRPRTALFGQK